MDRRISSNTTCSYDVEKFLYADPLYSRSLSNQDDGKILCFYFRILLIENFCHWLICFHRLFITVYEDTSGPCLWILWFHTQPPLRHFFNDDSKPRQKGSYFWAWSKVAGYYSDLSSLKSTAHLLCFSLVGHRNLFDCCSRVLLMIIVTPISSSRPNRRWRPSVSALSDLYTLPALFLHNPMHTVHF